jgi:hypothetical protein
MESFCKVSILQNVSKNVSIHLSNTEEKTETERVQDQDVKKDVWM